LCQWSKLPFFAFVGADCIPRSESASTIASLKACDAKGAKGVFWRLYRMSLFCNRADLWLVTCSMAFYTVESQRFSVSQMRRFSLKFNG
jgi:hypothetical protein